MSLFTQRLTVLGWGTVWAGVALAQTQVDLTKQAKSVDLSNLGPTKPVQVGTVVPTTCGTGQLFFNSAATPGANLYACINTNTWVVLSGASSGGTGGTGGGDVSNNGSSVAGDLPVYLDTTGTTLVDSGIAGSPAVLMTEVTYQAGTPLDCVGETGDTATIMSCLLNPTSFGYILHMPLRFTPHLANSGAFTLNADQNGATPVKYADCLTDPDPGYFQPGQTYQLSYNGTNFCEAHGGSNFTVKSVPPYLRIGTSYFLPFAFQASLPPASGWTAANFVSATFTTSGLGGAVAIQSGSSRSGEALNLQILSRSGTSTLIAAVSSGGKSASSSFGACGVGVYNSSAQSGYVLMQQLQAAAGMLLEAGYSSPTAQSFAGNTALSSVGGVVYLQVQISGSNVITSYSPTGGPGSWIQLNSRALGSSGMPSSVDSWSFFAEPAGSSPSSCQLLSWSAM